MRRVTRRVTSKSRLWINEIKVSCLSEARLLFPVYFLKYLDQRLDSFDSFLEDTVTTMHLSTLWVSANKNWTFVCLALAKKKLQNQHTWKIDPRPSTPRPKVRLACEIAKKKRPAKVTFYILMSWRGWHLKRLRIGRAASPLSRAPEKTPMLRRLRTSTTLDLKNNKLSRY